MNIKETIVKRLFDSGMFAKSAEEVMTAVMGSEENEDMKGRWGDSPDAYPEIIVELAWISAKRHAIIWIDENCPNAWYRPILDT